MERIMSDLARLRVSGSKISMLERCKRWGVYPTLIIAPAIKNTCFFVH